jgi:GSH-dependent disulfide-bond oxidoreductase
MIDLHYAPTPNGWKISIMPEELSLPYQVIPVNIRAGDQNSIKRVVQAARQQ